MSATEQQQQTDFSVLENITAEGLANILAQLQQPDTNAVKQATALLKQFFKTVRALELLLVLMATHEQQVIRQFSTVYLRKVIGTLWVSLPTDDQIKTKNLLIERFIAEPVAVVKKNIADVIGQLGKLLIPQQQWPELFQLVFTYTQSEDLVQKELAMQLLSVMVEYFSASEISTYYDQLNPIIKQYLQSDQASLKRLAVTTVNNLTQTGHGTKVLKQYPDLIPLVLNAIDISQEDLIKTIFETLTDCFDVKKVLRPHLAILVDAAVNLSKNTEMSLNVRSTTLFFLEQLGENFGKALLKKDGGKIQQIIECGCIIASEDDSAYADDNENPHELALEMLNNYACELPNEAAYAMFKPAIVNLCSSQDDPLKRRAGLRIMGTVCDSDALLDPIKDDVELFTDIIIRGLQDPEQMVREAACLTIGNFAEDVIPDFLDQHAKVMPVLLQVLQQQVEVATQSEDHASYAERALHALGEFSGSMEEYEIKMYLQGSVDTCLAYLLGPNQMRKTRYMALDALSPIIIASEHQILPMQQSLLQAFFTTIDNCTTIQDQQIKGKTLMCAGNLAFSCGPGNFPGDALERFTQFALECLQQNESKFELKETAMNYFSEIAKILKSQMAQIIPMIIEPILAATETQISSVKVDNKEGGAEFDLDSEDDDDEEIMMDLEGVDEQVAAVHALGNLSLYCSGIMQPHLERVCEALLKLSAYEHENVRYHVCLTLTQIGFGILRLNLGKQDSDDKIEWQAGLPVQQPLPVNVKTYLDNILVPRFKEVMKNDCTKGVVEKALECIRDLTDEMGPAAVEDHLEWITTVLEQLLDKTSTCQTGQDPDDDFGPQEGESDDEQDDDEEDLDHDEIILGNATDLVISLSKCLQNSFVPYLQRIGPKLVKYLGDEHGKSDRIMVIGCLAETFNQCPAALDIYFNDFMQVLYKHSTGTDGSLNRNVSYAFAICADKAPMEQFMPHLQNTFQAIKAMHIASDEDDAKDNCLAAFVRILERYHAHLPADESEALFQQIMGSLPLEGDPCENQTMLKFIMNINATQSEKILPHMDRVTLLCLKLLTDSRCRRDLDESFKVLTAKFIKNVIMGCGLPEVIQKLQGYESQMSAFERTELTKYMALA